MVFPLRLNRPRIFAIRTSRGGGGLVPVGLPDHVLFLTGSNCPPPSLSMLLNFLQTFTGDTDLVGDALQTDCYQKTWA
jgi:hypothetical protein